MSETYARTVSVERGPTKGSLHGIIATDGEAADGHILSIRGAKAEAPAPLLFGHDATSGRSNLGSWLRFDTKYGQRALGDSAIRGFAQIELGGEGPQAAWRNDIAHMVEQGHLRAFSVRWEPTEKPVRRDELPKEHAAHSHGKGFFFPRWQLLEASLVTLGADPKALIGRAVEGPKELAPDWLRAAAECLASGEPLDLDASTEHAKAILAEARTRLLESNDRLRTAVDLALRQLVRMDEPRVPAEVAPATPPLAAAAEPVPKAPARHMTADAFLADYGQLLADSDKRLMSAFLEHLDGRIGKV